MIDRLLELLKGRPREEKDPLEKERMVKASGITYLNLVCTSETWSEIESMCTPGGAGFAKEIGLTHCVLGPTSPRTREDGLVEVRLTGLQVSEILYWTAGQRSSPLAQGALATRVYDEVGKSVDRIDLEAKDGAQLEDIVIDARLGTP
ncbi:hypothetical protein OS965_38830 [Streptomyces sp. H27-G5]|uniref:hypothetical protein n=1 Tax=Streptomyces sp. H27-G5 TaxID=2996698 RepID=UPI0022706592|nr:hypothetical protein [Streptomyces sp. H27-G5]MCY0924013.1 hypothetical protein [Streptomyces sp. H27-G5]